MFLLKEKKDNKIVTNTAIVVSSGIATGGIATGATYLHLNDTKNIKKVYKAFLNKLDPRDGKPIGFGFKDLSDILKDLKAFPGIDFDVTEEIKEVAAKLKNIKPTFLKEYKENAKKLITKNGAIGLSVGAGVALVALGINHLVNKGKKQD